MKINTTHNFTTMVKGHGNILVILATNKIIETPATNCETKDRRIDQLLFECELRNT
jgi:hypothetical protein